MANRRRARILGVGLLVLFATLLAGATLPGPVDPLPYRPDRKPELAGPLRPDATLTAVERVELGPGSGPEDVERDDFGGLYAGLASGVIARPGPRVGSVEPFADTGGRPLGLDLDRDGTLWVADADGGLLSVSSWGEVAVRADQAAGRSVGFADDVDTAPDGTVFFSDASTRFPLERIHLEPLEARPWGRLLRYDPRDDRTEVVLDGLYFANGVAVSRDGAFVLVAETFRYRIRRIWISGARAGQDEVFADNLPGFPDGVSLNPRGNFWVAISSIRNDLLDRVLHPRPWLKRLAARLPAPLLSGARAYGLVLEIGPDGTLLRSLHDPTGETFPYVTSVEEWDGTLYLGSVEGSAVGRLPLTRP